MSNMVRGGKTDAKRFAPCLACFVTKSNPTFLGITTLEKGLIGHGHRLGRSLFVAACACSIIFG
ncbi:MULTISPECIES: hypothetical protein [Cohaesibacter]|uniref:hypothetical protein n=1 Tax=Cohaesibacter TaxID=655352 RepID=UPI0010FF0BF1|nr:MULTISPECIES: hypothetical protein [Cohaesibacter]TLP48339.1 hypothetical protein FDK21_01350 [Cohaesibacter sp. CAU 1516]